MKNVPDRPITNDDANDLCLVCREELQDEGSCADHGSLDAQMEHMWGAQAEARQDRLAEQDL